MAPSSPNTQDRPTSYPCPGCGAPVSLGSDPCHPARRSSVEVRGFKVSARSQRRYLVVFVRPVSVPTEDGVLVAYANVQKRTDSLERARQLATRANLARAAGRGALAVVVDLNTGEEPPPR